MPGLRRLRRLHNAVSVTDGIRGEVQVSTSRLSEALVDRYRIERELGAGGMATVYLAHDVRHDRRVALKVLRPELAAVIGAERFLAEIRTTANLQHPHILALFDSGQVDGTVFYVMPFVDGESLRDRMDREKQLPIEEALRIAREVGDALQYAHGLGVIHRDIKPENILLQGGHALVADFGIALAAAKTGGTRMTETGMSLGTPRYMSPEQAMGERTLDARADVYALGCVLYEMLTGDAPFTGSTAQAIVAKVLTEKPAPIIPRRDRVPPHVEDAVLTALEKLPADRFATAGEFVAALKGDTSATGTVTRARAAAKRGSQRQLIAIAVAVAAVAAVGGWLLGRDNDAPDEPAPSRLALVEPGANITFDGLRRTIDISADGQTVVFVGDRPEGMAVLARRMDGSESRVILPRQDGNIRLSPDGRFLYSSFGSGTLNRTPMGGGATTPVVGVEATPYLGFQDSTIWWGSYLSSGTWRHTPDGRDTLMFARSTIGQVLPGGRYGVGVGLFVGLNSGPAQLMNLRTGEVTVLFDTPVVDVRFTKGYLLFVRSDNTMAAVPFDPEAGRVTGNPVDIASDVSISVIGFAQWAVAGNGTVVYIPGSESDFVRVSRDGEVRVLLAERRRYHSPRIAPNGDRIAFDAISSDGRDVWVYSLATQDVTRATFQRDGHDPEWTHDGRGLYYVSANGPRLDIFRTQLGTTAQAVPENTAVEISHTGTRLGRDSVIVTTVPGRTGRGLDVIRLAQRQAKVDTLLGTDADETYPVVSPDGRWYAYISDHSQRPELYLRALGGSDVQLQVSVDGASEPMWSKDGKELFYRAGTQLVAARLTLDPQPRVVDRKNLFNVSELDAAGPHANYDVSPDGRWFVFARRGGANHIVVMQNVHELARRLARGGGNVP
jgi:Tol biopolymer transport system component/tRNA A-37 threonylcarbamoyl transferase component Bud32